MRFDNPTKSVQNMSLEMILHGDVIAYSGLIQPGKRIRTMTLTQDAWERLNPGRYTTEAYFLVRFFDPNTNECAILQSEIEIEIIVQE